MNKKIAKLHTRQKEKSQTSIFFKIILAILSVSMINCAGYKLGTSKPENLTNVNKIFVPTTKNLTLEPQLGALTASAIVSEFHKDGSYLVGNNSNSDATLKTVIRKIDRIPISALRSNVLTTNRLKFVITVESTLTDNNTGNVIRSFTSNGESKQFLDDNQQITEKYALTLAARDAAEQIVQSLTEGF